MPVPPVPGKAASLDTISRLQWVMSDESPPASQPVINTRDGPCPGHLSRGCPTITSRDWFRAGLYWLQYAVILSWWVCIRNCFNQWGMMTGHHLGKDQLKTNDVIVGLPPMQWFLMSVCRVTACRGSVPSADQDWLSAGDRKTQRAMFIFCVPWPASWQLVPGHCPLIETRGSFTPAPNLSSPGQQTDETRQRCLTMFGIAYCPSYVCSPNHQLQNKQVAFRQNW